MGVGTQFFFDPKKLVILGHPVAAAGCAGFNLTCVQSYGQICDAGVFRFTGTVGNDGGVTGPVSHRNGIQSLRQGADLIDFNQDGIGDAFFDALCQPLHIGDKEIVSHQLYFAANGFGQHGPAFPIRFGHAVFQRDDGVLLCKPLPHGDHLLPVQDFSGLGQVIETLFFLVPFGGGCVNGNHKILTGDVSGLFDSVYNHSQRVFIFFQIGCIAAFVTHTGSGDSLCLQHAFQGMEDFRAAAKCFTPGMGGHRHNHEFLNVHVVGCVGTAVQNIHHRQRQHLCVVAAHIAVEGDIQGRCSSFCHSQGDTQNGVGTQTALIGGSVQLYELPIDANLIHDIHANQHFADFRIDVVYCLADALSKKTPGIAVPKFASFIDTGGSTGRNGCSAQTAVFQQNVYLNGGIAAGIENFPTFYRNNMFHYVCSFPLDFDDSISLMRRFFCDFVT